MRVDGLTRSAFAACPVWTWDDSHEGYESVDTAEEPPGDTLFVKARVDAANGMEFDGYIVNDHPYAIGIFVGNDQFILNLNLQDLWAEDLASIAQLSGATGDLLPLRYRTCVPYPDGRTMEGVFTRDGQT